VQLPDGASGFVSEGLTRPTREPVRTIRRGSAQLLDRPVAAAALIANVETSSRLAVLGRFNDFLLVRTPDGTEGWIVSPPAGAG
jgi:hypothetical protein